MRPRMLGLLPFVLVCSQCSAPLPSPIPDREPASVGNDATEYVWENTSVENASADMDGPPLDGPTRPDVPSQSTGSDGGLKDIPVAVQAYAQTAPVRTHVAYAAAPAIPSTPAETSEPCAAIRGRLATPADCREYARQRAAISAGLAAFQPPSSLVVGSPVTLTLSVGAAGDKAVVNALGGDPNAVRQLVIQIGDSVSAELTGSPDLFDISPRGPQVKPMPDNKRELWNWDVTAKTPGKHQLTLIIGVPAVGGSGVPAFFLEPKAYPVDVIARPKTLKERVEDAGKFFTSLKGMLVALAAAIAAAGGVWFAVRNFGKTPVKAPEADKTDKPSA